MNEARWTAERETVLGHRSSERGNEVEEAL